MTYDCVNKYDAIEVNDRRQHILVRRINATSAGARIRGRLPSVQSRQRRSYLAGGSKDSAQFTRPGPHIGGDQSSH